MSGALGLSVLLPLVGTTATLLLRGRLRDTAAAVVSLATLGAVVAIVVAVTRDGLVDEDLGGWAAPLGIGVRADGLSAALMAMTAGVGTIVGAHALRSLRPADGGRPGWSERDGFWPLWLGAWAAMNALYLSRDLFNVYVGLELLTVAAVALVVLGGRTRNVVAGTRYLLAALLASLAYLLGVVLVYGLTGTLDMELVAERLEPGLAASVALAAMILGLALKTALFPLHFWLPQAHASAAPPVSALLSALVVKASFYVVLRLMADVVPAEMAVPAATALGLLGAGAVIVGSLQAVRQARLKLMIAHSTVAQIGYLFLAFPLAFAGGAETVAAGGLDGQAFTGGGAQAVAHGIAKAAIFLAAGNYALAAGSDRIHGLAGVGGHLPMTTFAFAVAGVSLIGLPPTGGFVAKWLLVSSAFSTGAWWWGVVIVVGGVLTAFYVFTVLKRALGERESTECLRPVPRALEMTVLVLAFAALGIGLAAAPLVDLLGIGRELGGEVPG